jgi:PKD repeat protein
MRTIVVALLAGIALVVASPVAAATEVHLIAPADGTTLVAGETLLAEFQATFERGVFPAAVRLDVARDADFTDLVDREEVGCSTAEPSCPMTLMSVPLPPGSYFWRVSGLYAPDRNPTAYFPSETRTFIVAANVTPVPVVKFAPVSPHPGDTVSFDGTASDDPDGSIVAWEWRFGNGNGAGGSPLAGVTYENEGTYVVTLVVTDNLGLKAATSIEVKVAVPDAPAEPPPPPSSIPPPSSTPPLTPPPPSPPTPTETPAAKDTRAPVARALASRGISGRVVKLRYRVRDESGTATVMATVRRSGRVITTLRAFVNATSSSPHFFSWRAPLRAGPLVLCVRATDAAGNRSASTCAPLFLKRGP